LAQFMLGVMYSRGEGTPQDYKQAAHWYRQAAERGEARAQYNLGSMYAKGQGAPRDYVRAHMWLNLAAASGGTKAVKSKEMLEKRMTPSQIEEAKRLAKQWKPKKSR
jgi:TPR repeat protein